MEQKAFIGTNAIVEWLQTMQTLHPRCCFLVRGKHSFEVCGGRQVVDELQRETQCAIIEYSDFSVNPKLDEANIGVERFMQARADVIVAIGGGSVMDMAKLIRHLAAEKGCYVPLYAIPTTAGTGAEATHFAVAYVDGKKQSIAADDILPDAAIIYPPLTYSNGTYQTACAGFDAVAQAIESYWAKGATQESQAYSIKALQMLWKQLPLLVKSPTEELRNQVAEGAYWAGRAINISTTTAPHAFSYAFTSHYGYLHGHAVALTFPFFMQLNGTEALFEMLGLSSTNIVQQMEDYISSLGLSLQLQPSVDIMGTLHEVNLQRLANNPVEVTKEVVDMLERYLRRTSFVTK